MWKQLCLGLTFTLLLADPAAVPFTAHSGHFERNDSGLKGAVSTLLIESNAEFEKLFGVAAVMRQKQNFVKPELFAKRLVCAVIHRGTDPWTYEVKSVTQAGETIEVRYLANGQPRSGTANFAYPQLLSLDRTDAKQIVLIENNKELAKLAVQAPAPTQP